MSVYSKSPHTCTLGDFDKYGYGSQSETDGQTDRQTDRQTEHSVFQALTEIWGLILFSLFVGVVVGFSRSFSC